MKPESTRPVQHVVTADNCERREAVGKVPERAVTAETLLAGLKGELMRRISEARTAKDVALIYDRPISVALAKARESELVGLIEWLAAQKTASSVGSNDV